MAGYLTAKEFKGGWGRPWKRGNIFEYW